MRSIVFDLDGTLLEYTASDDELLSDAVEAAGISVDSAGLEGYYDAFGERFEACEPDPVRGAFEAIGLEAAADRLADALLEREIEASRPPQGARRDLERLAAEYRLGVLTDGVSAWQREKLRAHDLGSLVDEAVTSYDVGAHKPAVEPFAALESRLPADTYAMVGDSDDVVAGARAAGWMAHRYDGDGFGDLPVVLER